jgi:hypothetical protein
MSRLPAFSRVVGLRAGREQHSMPRLRPWPLEDPQHVSVSMTLLSPLWQTEHGALADPRECAFRGAHGRPLLEHRLGPLLAEPSVARR